MKAAEVLNVLIRAAAGSALALGLAFWLGYARSLTQLHMGLGIGLVLCVWATSWVAWSTNTRRGLAALGVVCGVVAWVLGITQSVILPGPFHWVVQIAHLALGIITTAVGLRLAIAVSHRRVVSSAS